MHSVQFFRFNYIFKGVIVVQYMDKNVKTLEEFGLSDEEARLYLAGLSLGPTTMLKLARSANVQRTSAYRVADSLISRGLMKVELKGLKKLYAVESPENLKRSLEQKTAQLNDLLPTLMASFNKRGKDTLIKYYEGVEGVKSVYEGFLRETRSGEPYYVISSHHEWYKVDEKWFSNFSDRRNAKGLDFKFFLLDSEHARRLKDREEVLGLKVKILPKNLHFTSILIITQYRVLIHNLEPPIEGLVIENQDMITMFFQIFNVMWASIEG